MMYTDLYSFEGPAATDAGSALGAVRNKGMKVETRRASARRKTVFAGAIGTVITNFGAKPQRNGE